MEFSFFLVLITAAGLIFYKTGRVLFRFLLKPFRSMLSEKRKMRFYFALSAGFIVMIITGWFYLNRAEIIWNTVMRWMDYRFETIPVLSGSRLPDVAYVFRFFRDYYPALAGFLTLTVVWSAADRHVSEGYRFIQKYRNWMLPVLGFFWLAVLALWKWQAFRLDNWEGRFLLCGAVYFTLVYSWKGFLLLAYGLKKMGIRFWLACCALYLLLVLSGAAFLFVLMLFMGIGITDTWMNYQRKGKRNGEFR